MPARQARIEQVGIGRMAVEVRRDILASQDLSGKTRTRNGRYARMGYQDRQITHPTLVSTSNQHPNSLFDNGTLPHLLAFPYSTAKTRPFLALPRQFIYGYRYVPLKPFSTCRAGNE